ncbi:MAG: hypothetical protein Q4D19_12355 [Lautropia sp.]|nr:hypothetical protein [Lautropia sp.]
MASHISTGPVLARNHIISTKKLHGKAGQQPANARKPEEDDDDDAMLFPQGDAGAGMNAPVGAESAGSAGNAASGTSAATGAEAGMTGGASSTALSAAGSNVPGTAAPAAGSEMLRSAGILTGLALFSGAAIAAIDDQSDAGSDAQAGTPPAATSDTINGTGTPANTASQAQDQRVTAADTTAQSASTAPATQADASSSSNTQNTGTPADPANTSNTTPTGTATQPGTAGSTTPAVELSSAPTPDYPQSKTQEIVAATDSGAIRLNKRLITGRDLSKAPAWIKVTSIDETDDTNTQESALFYEKDGQQIRMQEGDVIESTYFDALYWDTNQTNGGSFKFDAFGADDKQINAADGQGIMIAEGTPSRLLFQIDARWFPALMNAYYPDTETPAAYRVAAITEAGDTNGKTDALILGNSDNHLKVGDIISADDTQQVFWDFASNSGGEWSVVPLRADGTAIGNYPMAIEVQAGDRNGASYYTDTTDQPDTSAPAAPQAGTTTKTLGMSAAPVELPHQTTEYGLASPLGTLLDEPAHTPLI